MDPFVKIALGGIEADKDARSQSRYIVTFECHVGSHRFSIPIAVGDVEEGEIVRVARGRLHQILGVLAEHSEVWATPEEEMREMVRR